MERDQSHGIEKGCTSRGGNPDITKDNADMQMMYLLGWIDDCKTFLGRDGHRLAQHRDLESVLRDIEWLQ
jgi:hypothetical protein